MQVPHVVGDYFAGIRGGSHPAGDDSEQISAHDGGEKDVAIQVNRIGLFRIPYELIEDRNAARTEQQKDEARVDVLLTQLKELLLPLLGLVKIIGSDGVGAPGS